MITRPLIELPLLAAIWGASFIFMKIGGPEFGPVLFMAIRTTVASLLLVPIMRLSKQHTEVNNVKLHLFTVGLLNTAIPFVLFGWATLTLTAGSTSFLNATVPMFGAIVAFLWLKEKLSSSAIIGLVIGFIGVYLLMSEKLHLPQTNVILPTIAVMFAALCYGISANYTKKYLSHVKPIALAAGSQVSASLVLIPISLAFIPSQMPSMSAIGSVLFIGVVCTGLAYIIFFRLIAALGPTKAISVTYLIPVFGLVWGILFLYETVTSTMLFGCTLIMLGVALTTGVVKFRRKTLAI